MKVLAWGSLLAGLLAGQAAAKAGTNIEDERLEYSVADYYPGDMPRPHEFLKIYSPSFVPELMMMETPIMVYTTMRDFQLMWNCVAVMSATFKDSITRKDPLYRAPEMTYNSYDRMLCSTYALDLYGSWLYKEGVAKHAANMKSWGLYKDQITKETYEDILACSMQGAKKATQCLRNMAPSPRNASRRQIAAYAAGVVAAGMYMSMTEDDWNFNGKHAKGKNGRECDRPWCDWTGYVPPNDPWELKEVTKWQPLVEENGRGFYYSQEHVTPHIYNQKPFGVPDNAEFWGRQTPDPEYDLDKEMELAYERLAGLAGDDRRISIAERMDNKVQVFASILAKLQATYSMSMEVAVWTCLGYIVAEHDAVVITWREKVRHSLVRPTSYSQSVVEEKMVDYWTGEKISTKLWAPFIRVMPHAEYPSGSASICTVAYEFTQSLVQGEYGDDDVSTTWVYKAGSNKFAKGLPKEDFVEELESLKDVQYQCGQSRLWGGMHFTASIEAAEKLVEGYGSEIYDAIVALLGGGKLPQIPVEKDCGKMMYQQKRGLKSVKPDGQRNIKTACDCKAKCLTVSFENGKPAASFGFGSSRRKAKEGKNQCTCYDKFNGYQKPSNGFIVGEL